jgi:starvation-inducible outer membrane lipoprotein
MKLMLLGIAAVALTVTGCTSYPAAIQTAMAQALPPYHQDNNVDMDAAAGMTPVQSATHLGIRVSPFGN